MTGKNRFRKIALILQSYEKSLEAENLVNRNYLGEILKILLEPSAARDEITPAVLSLAAALRGSKDGLGEKELRLINNLRHNLLKVLNIQPADWDLYHPRLFPSDPPARETFPGRVFLESLRSPFNVGSIFRTAEAFGVEEILITPDSPDPGHRRVQRSAMGTTAYLPWTQSSLNELERMEGVFALETGGTALDRFTFPPKGVMILGSEELGISSEALAIARKKSGVVSIPLAGNKASLNVAVAFGIAVSAWQRALRKPYETKRI